MTSNRQVQRNIKSEKDKIMEKFMNVESELDPLSDIFTNKLEHSHREDVDMVAEIIGTFETVDEYEGLSMNEKLREWYLRHRPSRRCVEDLVKILREENYNLDNYASKPTEQNAGGRSCSCQRGIGNKIDEMKVALQRQLSVVQGQIKIAVEALAEQKVILRTSVKQQHVGGDHSSLDYLFPLSTEDQLIELNEEINEDNRHLYIDKMKTLISRDGIRKNLREIISTEIAVAYNVEGNHGKKAFKSLTNFYGALLQSIPVTETSGTPEVQLRVAIQLMKRRHFKNMSMEKKKNAYV